MIHLRVQYNAKLINHFVLTSYARKHLLYFILSLLIIINIPVSIAQTTSPVKLKSAIIYDITTHITWKNINNLNEFTIGVYGDNNELYRELKSRSKVAKIKNKPVIIVRYSDIEKAKKAQVLYLSRSANINLEYLAQSVRKSNTLLISDGSMKKKDVMINFIYLKGNKISFEINKPNVIDENLSMSNEILLLGGTELDVFTIYKEMEAQLINTRRKVDQQEKQLSTLQNKIKGQVIELNKYEKKIRQDKLLITKHEKIIKEQNKNLSDQQILIKENEAIVEGLEENVKTTEQALRRQLHEFEKNKKKALELGQRIKESQRILESQQLAIKDKTELIHVQKGEIASKEEQLSIQRILLISTIFIITLILALLFAIYRSYKTNKRNALKLEEKNQQLIEKQSQLIQSEKLASLGQLTAGIAHEINNPVTFILTGSSLLSRDFEDLLEVLNNLDKLIVEKLDKETIKEIEEFKEKNEYDYLKENMQEVISDIRTGGVRTAEIVKSITSFARREKSEKSIGDINQALDYSILILRNKYKHKAEIIKEYDEFLPNLLCYPVQISQVFLNVLANAIDAIENKGTVTISTRKIDNSIEIVISDNGIGMTEAVKNKIFEPMFTTKPENKGTGLGLSITLDIIKRHMGTIEVESKVNEGTTFKILLPLIKEEE